MILKRKKWSLPFGPTDISPGETKTLTCNIGTIFEGYGIVNQGDEDGLYIVDILADSKTQMPRNTPLGGIPVNSFRESVFAGNCSFDRCRTLELKIHNSRNASRVFTATVTGAVFVEIADA